METDTKIKIIEILNLNPNELDYLKFFNIPNNIIYDKENLELLKQYFNNIISDKKQNEEVRLIAACFKNRILPTKLDIHWSNNEEDDFNDEEDNWMDTDNTMSNEDKIALKELEKERNQLWLDREKKFHKSLPQLKKYTQEEMNEIMFNHIWNNFPQLQKGYDRSVYSRAKESFLEYIGVSWYRAQLPFEVDNKIDNAQEYVKNEIINRFRQFESNNIDTWLNEIKALKLKKYTKTFISSFLKEKGLKVSDTTISFIKENV